MNKFFIMLALTLAVSSARADLVIPDQNAQAQSDFQAAQEAFAKRTAFAKDEAVVDQAVALLNKALSEAQTDDLRYRILYTTTRVLVWKGVHTTVNLKDEVQKKALAALYETAYKKADEARNLNKKAYAKYAEANYYYAVAMGRWALVLDPMNVITEKPKMVEALNAANAGKTLDGESGEEFDYFGASRVIGRMETELHKKMAFLGDKDLALKNLELAYTNAPEHTLNYVYYADILNVHKKTKEACEVLAALAEYGKKPESEFPADRIQDSLEDIADGAKLAADFKCVK